MPYNLTEQPEFLDEIEVPEGSDVVARSALISAYQRLADRTRNLVTRLGGRQGAGEWVYSDEAGDPVPKSRFVRINPLTAVVISGSAPVDSSLRINVDGTIYIPLVLPSGSVIRGVRLEGIRTPGVGITVSANLRKGGTLFWGPVTDSDPYDDFLIAESSLSETVDPASVYALVVTTSDSALLELIRVTVDDPGPRNF